MRALVGIGRLQSLGRRGTEDERGGVGVGVANHEGGPAGGRHGQLGIEIPAGNVQHLAGAAEPEPVAQSAHRLICRIRWPGLGSHMGQYQRRERLSHSCHPSRCR